jgi:hypothetical protein
VNASVRWLDFDQELHHCTTQPKGATPSFTAVPKNMINDTDGRSLSLFLLDRTSNLAIAYLLSLSLTGCDGYYNVKTYSRTITRSQQPQQHHHGGSRCTRTRMYDVFHRFVDLTYGTVGVVTT